MFTTSTLTPSQPHTLIPWLPSFPFDNQASHHHMFTTSTLTPSYPHTLTCSQPQPSHPHTLIPWLPSFPFVLEIQAGQQDQDFPARGEVRERRRGRGGGGIEEVERGYYDRCTVRLHCTPRDVLTLNPGSPLLPPSPVSPSRPLCPFTPCGGLENITDIT